MLPSKNNGTSTANWVFGLVCAAIGFVATYTVGKAKALGRRLKPAVVEVPLTPEQAEQVRYAFFNATFSIMGHVAKADGPIQKTQIASANSVMQRMELNAERRALAIELFNQGKHSDFELDRQAKRFRDGCASSTDFYRVFLETQIETALADGHMTHEKEAILLHVAKVLGMSKGDFRELEVLVRVRLGLGDNHNNRSRSESSRSERRSRANQQLSATARAAYGVLGVNHDDHKSTVIAAYRKLMNQYHPDKLASNGLPKEMLKLSTNKTQQIQQAYDQIKLAKNW